MIFRRQRHKKEKRFRWIALKLSVLMILIFVLQVIFPAITENFLLVSDEKFERPWLFVTSIFLHGSLTHLLFNIFALFLFGSLLEKKIGSNQFLFFFLLTGIIAGIVGSLFYERMLGASGAIYGIIGMLTAIQPLTMVFAFGVPMPIFIASILWILVDFGSFTSSLAGIPGGIANAAHLAGIFSGIFFGLIFRRYLRWQRLRERGVASRYTYHEDRLRRLEKI